MTEYTEDQKERMREIYVGLLRQGYTEQDATAITRFTIMLFPETPLDKLNLFADGFPDEGE